MKIKILLIFLLCLTGCGNSKDNKKGEEIYRKLESNEYIFFFSVDDNYYNEEGLCVYEYRGQEDQFCEYKKINTYDDFKIDFKTLGYTLKNDIYSSEAEAVFSVSGDKGKPDSWKYEFQLILDEGAWMSYIWSDKGSYVLVNYDFDYNLCTYIESGEGDEAYAECTSKEEISEAKKMIKEYNRLLTLYEIDNKEDFQTMIEWSLQNKIDLAIKKINNKATND